MPCLTFSFYLCYVFKHGTVPPKTRYQAVLRHSSRHFESPHYIKKPTWHCPIPHCTLLVMLAGSCSPFESKLHPIPLYIVLSCARTHFESLYSVNELTYAPYRFCKCTIYVKNCSQCFFFTGVEALLGGMPNFQKFAFVSVCVP